MTEVGPQIVETCDEPLRAEEKAQGFADTDGSMKRLGSSLIYDTRNFALRRSLSCLALGRLGEVCGSQCILDKLDRETDV